MAKPVSRPAMAAPTAFTPPCLRLGPSSMPASWHPSSMSEPSASRSRRPNTVRTASRGHPNCFPTATSRPSGKPHCRTSQTPAVGGGAWQTCSPPRTTIQAAAFQWQSPSPVPTSLKSAATTSPLNTRSQTRARFRSAAACQETARRRSNPSSPRIKLPRISRPPPTPTSSTIRSIRRMP